VPWSSVARRAHSCALRSLPRLRVAAACCVRSCLIGTTLAVSQHIATIASRLKWHSCLTSMTVCAGLPSAPPAAAAAASSPADSRDLLCGVGKLSVPAELLAGLVRLPGSDSGGLLLERCGCRCCWLAAGSGAARLRLLLPAGLRELPPLAVLAVVGLLLAVTLLLEPPLAAPPCVELPATLSGRAGTAGAAALPAGGAGAWRVSAAGPAVCGGC
jgi:hypothetical protein